MSIYLAYLLTYLGTYLFVCLFIYLLFIFIMTSFTKYNVIKAIKEKREEKNNKKLSNGWVVYNVTNFTSIQRSQTAVATNTVSQK